MTQVLNPRDHLSLVPGGDKDAPPQREAVIFSCWCGVAGGPRQEFSSVASCAGIEEAKLVAEEGPAVSNGGPTR